MPWVIAAIALAYLNGALASGRYFYRRVFDLERDRVIRAMNSVLFALIWPAAWTPYGLALLIAWAVNRW